MSKTIVLITGASGFLGKNLQAFLRLRPDVQVMGCDIDSLPEIREKGLQEAHVIFHLAGINRPERVEEFERGNTGLTTEICERLQALKRTPTIVFSSSIQANLDNSYGVSKRKAEEKLCSFGKQSGARVIIFRFQNVFGKWCRPNYNSVVATFCYNIAHDLPISVSDPTRQLNLIYVDDVCRAMIQAAGLRPIDAEARDSHNVDAQGFAKVIPDFTITLGGLVEAIHSFQDCRNTLQVPSFNDPLIKRLYATFLSYLDDTNFAYNLDTKTDNRGSLVEILKAPSFGQIFVSQTKSGITRGNHYHHTKTEKFLVIQGKAVVRLRNVLEDKIIEYFTKAEDYKVIDIPPGYTHSIENVGEEELITLFWANEVFDPKQPDTFFEKVLLE